MKCPKCQSETGEGVRFCPSCQVDLDKLRAGGMLAQLGPDTRGIDAMDEAAGPGWDFFHATKMALADLLKVIALGALTLTVLLAVAAFQLPEYRLGLICGAAGSLLVTLLVGAWAFRGKSELLPMLGPVTSLVELNDVQFLWETPTGVQLRGTVFWMRVLLQNCVNRPRAVKLRFGWEPSSKATDPAVAMRLERQIEGVLGPGETAEVEIPLMINPAPPEQIEVWLSPSVNGELARRVRYATASEFVERVTNEETVVGAVLSGVLTGTVRISAGGGLAYRPQWWNDRPAGDDWDKPLPSAKWNVIDTPTRELLIAAAR